MKDKLKLVARKIKHDGKTVGWNIFQDEMTVPTVVLTVDFDVLRVTVPRDMELTDHLKPTYPNVHETSPIPPESFKRRVLWPIRIALERFYEEMRKESEAEMKSETAWIRNAELPTNDDAGFEQYEASRGVIPFEEELAAAYGR